MEDNKRLHGKGWLAVLHNTINSKHNQAKSETLLKKYIGERATERDMSLKNPVKKKKREKKRKKKRSIWRTSLICKYTVKGI